MTTEKSPQNLGNEPNKNEDLMLSMIREILLKEDREDIADIKAHFDDNEKLAERINPIIEIHVESMKRKFPREYQKQVERIVERKIKASQDELLDVVYPVMGKMVRKYVNHQFLSLKEGLDDRLGQLFSFKGWYNRIKAMVMGVDESEILLRDLDHTSIEEVFIIQRDSGLLMGHFSRNETIDRDVIAGMLTAIKSFVEDAFSKERQELELIDYGTYKIFIQSFHLYYISVILDGSISSAEKDALSAKLLDFAEKEMPNTLANDVSPSDYETLSMQLSKYF